MLLKTKDFIFEPYTASGDSGLLFLATRKSDGKRFVVKQASPDCACNEFLYHSIAREMGLTSVEFYLFEKDTERTGFMSGYAFAIEYINGARHLKSIGIEKGAVENWKEYFKGIVAESTKIKNSKEHFYHYAISRAFLEADRVELIRGKKGYLYRIDATESFDLPYNAIDMLINKGLSYVDERAKVLPEMIYTKICKGEAHVKDKCGDTEIALYREGIEKLAAVDFDRINEFIDQVCEIYPDILGAYYIEFFIACQDACDKYLSEVSNNNFRG